MAGRRASRAAINGARRRRAVVRAAKPVQDDETVRAGAERRAGHPGCVKRLSAQGHACSAWKRHDKGAPRLTACTGSGSVATGEAWRVSLLVACSSESKHRKALVWFARSLHAA